MGWIQVLYETYEKSREYIGKKDPKGCILLPIAHSTQNAQIEIVIDLNGSFISARRVEKAEAVTIIPVTEDSGTRSSGIAPHPLCDKLCYVAGDYEAYCIKKKAGEFYKAYRKLLEEWVQFGCHKYVKAVYSYIEKGTLIKDLVDEGILIPDENGRLKDGVKIEKVSQTEAFVRFRIQDEAVSGLGEVWKEQAVYDDYIRFYLSRLEEQGLDYITGEWIPCSEKQPSKIRNSGDKAKLISANDSLGFTYRGRFTSREQAICVGYIPSQEAHNALRWLIERQGYRRHGMCVVTWNPEAEEVPDWLSEDPFDTGEEVPLPDMGEDYAGEVNQALRGRYGKIDNPGKEIVVMSLNAATPGRLSIIYYQQMKGSDFLNHLVSWYTTCCWPLSYKKNQALRNRPSTPEPEDLVRAMYGVERNGLLDVDDKLMTDALKRLIPCMIEGKSIPADMVRSAFLNACRPLAFGKYNRRKVMEIACALIRKKDQDRNKNKKGEFDDMSLDRKNHNRDYLYGRLLAVAHKLEYDTFTKEEQEKRETNADRYRSMLVRNPVKIWPMIEERIQPYKKKLELKQQNRYAKEFCEIYDSFEGNDFSDTHSLGEQFLLGYHCQFSELWKPVAEKDK